MSIVIDAFGAALRNYCEYVRPCVFRFFELRRMELVGPRKAAVLLPCC